MEPLEKGERNARSPLRPDFVRQTVLLNFGFGPAISAALNTRSENVFFTENELER